VCSTTCRLIRDKLFVFTEDLYFNKYEACGLTEPFGVDCACDQNAEIVRSWDGMQHTLSWDIYFSIVSRYRYFCFLYPFNRRLSQRAAADHNMVLTHVVHIQDPIQVSIVRLFTAALPCLLSHLLPYRYTAPTGPHSLQSVVRSYFKLRNRPVCIPSTKGYFLHVPWEFQDTPPFS
jgi:hypothetical protein